MSQQGHRGKRLDPRLVEKVRLIHSYRSIIVDNLLQMSPEQIGQLYELMVAARGEMTEAQAEQQIEDTLTDMGIPVEKSTKS